MFVYVLWSKVHFLMRLLDFLCLANALRELAMKLLHFRHHLEMCVTSSAAVHQCPVAIQRATDGKWTVMNRTKGLCLCSLTSSENLRLLIIYEEMCPTCVLFLLSLQKKSSSPFSILICTTLGSGIPILWGYFRLSNHFKHLALKRLENSLTKRPLFKYL